MLLRAIQHHHRSRMSFEFIRTDEPFKILIVNFRSAQRRAPSAPDWSF